jgi:hypothetical protein
MQHKNISSKVQGWIFISLVLLWVLVLTFLFNFGHWKYGISVFLLPFAIEYVCRCIKAKKVIVPHKEKKPTNTHKITPELPANLITSISVLTVYQFTRCYAYDDLNVLDVWHVKPEGCRQGQHGEIKKCWEHLLSDYHAAVKNDNLINRIKLMRRKTIIDIRKETADKFGTMLKEAYSPHLAGELRKIFKEYKLTIDTVHKDLKQLQTALIKEKRERDRIVRELDDMDKGIKKDLTPEEKEIDIVDMLIEIRKHEQTNYNAKEMTVLEFARCQNRLTAHYERLKQQTNNG